MNIIKKIIKLKIKWVFLVSGLLSFLFVLFSIINLKYFPKDNFIFLALFIASIMYISLLIGIPVFTFLLNKWVFLFESLAITIKKSSTRNLIHFANVISSASFIWLLLGGILSIKMKELLVYYFISLVLFVFPILAFCRKLICENEKLLIVSVIKKMMDMVKINKLKEMYLPRRILYSVRELLSFRTIVLLVVIYMFMLILTSILNFSPNEFSVFSFSFSSILAVIFWVYWDDNGAERLRTRQIIVKAAGFIALILCAYLTVFQLSEVQMAAYFASVLTMYFFIDSLVAKMIEDKQIFERRKRKLLESNPKDDLETHE